MRCLNARRVKAARQMRIMRRRRPTRLFSAAAPEPGALAESAQWYRRRGCALRAWVECAGRISAGWAPRLPPILNNELYIGRIVWNRLRYVKDPETGKRISRLNGPDRWVVQDAPELRIIPQDIWEKATIASCHLSATRARMFMRNRFGHGSARAS